MRTHMKIFLAAMLIAAPFSWGKAQTYTCRSATAAATLAMQDYVVRLVTGTDSETVATRTRYQLPVVDSSKVSIVTTIKTCQSAGAAFEKAVNPPGTPAVSRSMVVIKVSNSRYVIVDPDERVGEYEANVVTDANFNVLAKFTS